MTYKAVAKHANRFFTEAPSERVLLHISSRNRWGCLGSVVSSGLGGETACPSIVAQDGRIYAVQVKAGVAGVGGVGPWVATKQATCPDLSSPRHVPWLLLAGSRHMASSPEAPAGRRCDGERQGHEQIEVGQLVVNRDYACA